MHYGLKSLFGHDAPSSSHVKKCMQLIDPLSVLSPRTWYLDNTKPLILRKGATCCTGTDPSSPQLTQSRVLVLELLSRYNLYIRRFTSKEKERFALLVCRAERWNPTRADRFIDCCFVASSQVCRTIGVIIAVTFHHRRVRTAGLYNRPRSL
jgi:hypothetical protein